MSWLFIDIPILPWQSVDCRGNSGIPRLPTGNMQIALIPGLQENITSFFDCDFVGGVKHVTSQACCNRLTVYLLSKTGCELLWLGVRAVCWFACTILTAKNLDAALSKVDTTIIYALV